MQKIGVMFGHTSRVLYLSMSANSQNIVTGAGDETLRFWDVFPKNQENSGDCSLFLTTDDMR